MKSLKEQIMNLCIHFNGVQNKKCALGVNYEEAFGKIPIRKMPCIKNRMKHLTSNIIVCDKLKFPSLKETNIVVAKIRKELNLSTAIYIAAKKHIDKTGKKNAIIKCPNGDHKFSYVQFEYNGHIHAACKICKISSME